MTQRLAQTLSLNVTRSWHILQKEGPRALWFKFLGETVYRRMDLAEKDILPAPDFVSSDEFEFGLLCVEEVDEYLAFRDYSSRDTVLNRIKKQDLCFLVRKKGQIIHAGWAATGQADIDYLRCSIRLAPGDVYLYEVYTSPQHRRSGVSTERFHFMQQYLHEKGYRRLLAVVWPENHAVQRSLVKSEYRISGRTGYFGPAPLRKHFLRYKGSKPPFSLSSATKSQSLEKDNGKWDTVAGNLDSNAQYLDPFLANLKRRENFKLVQKWGSTTSPGRILKTDSFEEAMGEDAFLGDLLTHYADVTGIDISHRIAHRASQRFSRQATCFLAADVRKLPFADASFSDIVSPSTLDHFADPSDLEKSLRELHRVLKPGGHLVVTLDNRQNLFDPILRAVHKMGWVPFFIGRSYRIEELEGELKSAGFEVREKTAILHNPRLTAVGLMRLVRWLRWKPLIRAAQRLILSAQKLENTRLCYYTGSFVAALAVRPADEKTNRSEK